MNDKFERGSEWRKWDLHIHTKGTQKNDNFTSVDFNSFCITLFKKALEKDISAIGITDYFNVDNFKKVREFISKVDSHQEFNDDEKARIKNIFILPNVEVRILPSTDSGRLINIHCLFNPDSSFLDGLENDFFCSLEDSGGNKMNRSGFIALGKRSDNRLPPDAAYKKGVEEFHLEPSKLIELFKIKPNLKENVIVIVSNSSNDGASAIQEHYKLFENETGSLEAVRRNIYNLSHAIFSANPKDREFFLGKKNGCNEQLVISKYGSLKPCIHGSDAHCEDKLFNPDENRFCWIKADLTFEGLKQILCEPKDRVKIQANKPEEKSGYHVIKSISINDEICKQTIPLNPNLNTIIGGRSTGKSTLLQLVAHRINPNLPDITEFVKKIPQEVIKVIWQDDEENKNRDIEFFPQSHMYEIARDKNKKNNLIRQIVEEKDSENIISSYESFCIGNKSSIQTDIDNLFKLQTRTNELNTTLKGIGDKDGLEKEIENLNFKIKTAHQDNTFSENNRIEFEVLTKAVLDLEQLIKKLKKDKKEITSLRNEDLFDSSFSYKFNQLSDLNTKTIQEVFDTVKKQAIQQWQDKLSSKLIELDELVSKHENDVQQKKESAKYTQGSSYLEQNKQYKELNDKLSIESKKLTEIISIQNQIDNVNLQKTTLFSQIINNHMAYIKKANELVTSFSLVHDDIQIKIEKLYCDSKCKELLKDFINLQGHERQGYVNNWGTRYQEATKSTIEIFLHATLEQTLELKTYKDIKDLAKGVLTENWFSISYELTYQNDTFEKMSDGKKAFVILKLLLEFSDKECPILMDQPEDSLDNRAIYNELVTYLKLKKKNRQIILVTHNANIVVNADSEEVIVANQHGNDSKNKDGIKFQYISGSLENTALKNSTIDIVLKSQGIREHVCEILEGGTEAFGKREDKYGMGKHK